MVTLQTAENALKTVYLGVVSNQLNINANPLLSKIKQTTADVWGKEIRKLAPVGINGGIGAGTEDGKLPAAAGNTYVQFVSTLKNLYGTIEISDKAIRASEHNAGAFVNLLNAEMEGLIKASSFNFGRMLYGDGSGLLAKVASHSTANDYFVVDDVRNLVEGMKIEFYYEFDDAVRTLSTYVGRRITAIDRANKRVYVTPKLTSALTTDDYVVVQGSYNLEITGLGAIFSTTGTLYGVNKATNPWMVPYIKTSVGDLEDVKIQEAIDYLDEVSGSAVDFIATSSKAKRSYLDYLATFRRHVDTMDLAGGFKAISYNGIPLVNDRFVKDGEMFLLNTKEFTLHQLCDWQWLEGEDGRVIRQTAGYPTYTATLVKYADLICDKPSGQAKLTGITIS